MTSLVAMEASLNVLSSVENFAALLSAFVLSPVQASGHHSLSAAGRAHQFGSDSQCHWKSFHETEQETLLPRSSQSWNPEDVAARSKEPELLFARGACYSGLHGRRPLLRVSDSPLYCRPSSFPSRSKMSEPASSTISRHSVIAEKMMDKKIKSACAHARRRISFETSY